MSDEKKVVGSDINSMCTKCKQSQGHVITSIVKDRIAQVQCRFCGSLHRYRNPDAPLKPPRKRPVSISPEEAWEKIMKRVASQKEIPYTFSGDFKVDDLINHFTFGLGVVTQILPDRKIQVIFKDSDKTLVARR